MAIAENRMKHVFISYVIEDQSSVDRLSKELRYRGVKVWSPGEILPGHRWLQSISNAIKEGAFFIACFSEHFLSREKNVMNEELLIALAEIRRRHANATWFIPVRLSDCEIPALATRPGETLLDLQRVDLYDDWQSGIENIFRTLGVSPLSELEEYSSELTQGLLLDQWQLIASRPGNLQTNVYYALKNLITQSSLEHGYVKRGVQLVWGHDSFKPVIAFETPEGHKQCNLRLGDKIAIRMKDKGYIMCRTAGYGINLAWSKSPAYQWIIGPLEAEKRVLTSGDKFSLYNTANKDHIVHFPRAHGVSIRWLGDCPEFGARFLRGLSDPGSQSFVYLDSPT